MTGLATAVGDGQVTLTWQPAQVDGTPVTGYEVEISPPPAGQQQIQSVGVTTSHAFTGLVNGTTYTFNVLAVNAEGNGPWSLGVSAVPYGKPLTMAAPAATGAPVPDPTTTRAIQVTWAAVQGTAANGRPVTSYTVYEYSSSSSGGPWTQVSTSTVRRQHDHRQLHGDQRQLLVRVHGHRHQPGRRVRAVAAVLPGRAGRRAAERADERDRDRDRAEQHDLGQLHRARGERQADQGRRVRHQRRRRRPARSTGRSPRAARPPSP